MLSNSGIAPCRRVRATLVTPRWNVVRASGLPLAGCLLALLALSGCASSSSETPWPVEPDFERLKAEAGGHPRQAHVGTEWTPREPEGDEVVEEEEPEPPSTWGARRKAVVAEPPPLKAGTPDPDPEVDEDEPTPKVKVTPSPASGIGDTDDIDSDPFFQDDEEDD